METAGFAEGDAESADGFFQIFHLLTTRTPMTKMREGSGLRARGVGLGS